MSFNDLTRVLSLFLYTTKGERIMSKYYDDIVPREKRMEFEKNIFKSVNDFSEQILQYEKYIVVFEKISDTTVLFVVGHSESNELQLHVTLQLIQQTLSSVFSGIEASALIRQIDLLYMTIDELIEQGYLFVLRESDAKDRVTLKVMK